MATQSPTSNLPVTHSTRLGFNVDFVAIAIAVALVVLIRLNIIPSIGF
jgi:hypothetical protein